MHGYGIYMYTHTVIPQANFTFIVIHIILLIDSMTNIRDIKKEFVLTTVNFAILIDQNKIF